MSCDDDVADSIFITKDYEPNIRIETNDSVFFDIDKNGKEDFIAFHAESSGYTYLTFRSININCLLSDGIIQPRKYIIKGDSINENLSWADNIIWVISEEDSENGNAYLAIEIVGEQSVNYGWLLPIVEGATSNHVLIIDKYAYCKIRNKEIVAGQRR
jgi:hypothetical protein